MNANIRVIEMTTVEEKRGSRRFKTGDDKAVLRDVYISRLWTEINSAHSVRVTIEIVGANAPAQPQVV